MIGKLINKIKFWNKKNDVFEKAERYLNDVPKNQPIEKYDAFNDLIRIDQYISEIEKAKELLKRNGYIILEKNKCTECGQYVNGIHYCSGKPINTTFKNEYNSKDIGNDFCKYADM